MCLCDTATAPLHSPNSGATEVPAKQALEARRCAGEGDWWGTGTGEQWRGDRGPTHSINFIAAHDGFTLADLVAHNTKHNSANGENNRWVHLKDRFIETLPEGLAVIFGCRQSCTLQAASPVLQSTEGASAANELAMQVRQWLCSFCHRGLISGCRAGMGRTTT